MGMSVPGKASEPVADPETCRIGAVHPTSWA